MRFKAFTVAGVALAAIVAFSMQLAAGEEDLAQRRVRLEKMSDAEKTRLLQKKRRFDDLPPAEQDRYRSLHQELVNDEHYEQLHSTLQRYSDWLKGLDPVKRAELLDLPAKERLARVKELMDAEATERFRLMVSEFIKSKELLSPKDKGVISKWTDDFVRDHQEEILATVHDRLFRVKVEDFDPNEHMHLLKFWLLRPDPRQFHRPPPDFDSAAGPPPLSPGPFPGRERAPGSEQGGRPNMSAVDDSFDALPKPSREEEDALLDKLSIQARNVIKKAASDEERSQIIQNWMRAAFWSGFTPSLEDLDRFVRESLSKEERERLESLPRELMYHELRKLYSKRRFRRGAGRQGMRPEGGGFGGPGGPGGPGGASGHEGGKSGFDGGRGRRSGSSGNKEWGPGRGRGDSPPQEKDRPPERGEGRGADGSKRPANNN